MTPYFDDGAMTIWHADARALPLDDESVDCIVTSPPYNVGMDYEGVDDSKPWDEYREDVQQWCSEMGRVLKPGGRCWVNVVHATNEGSDHGRDNGIRKNLLGLWSLALEDSGLHYRDTVAWAKGVGNQATAWGSYLSPNAPNLRGRWEPILLHFKDHWSRGRTDGQNDLGKDEWTELTQNVWKITPDGTARWHPAPFPREIVRRCILLSTWPGDVVLDPFMGSATTLEVARDYGRRVIGVDLSERYCERAVSRLAQLPLPLGGSV